MYMCPKNIFLGQNSQKWSKIAQDDKLAPSQPRWPKDVRNVLLTSFIGHNNNYGVRSRAFGVEDAQGNQVLCEHCEILEGMALEHV